MKEFFSRWSMLIAMLIGAFLYEYIGRLSFTLPYLLFTIMLLSFSKVSPKQIRIKPSHLWMLLLQIGLSVGTYYALSPLGDAIAQGAMICVFAPTATAAIAVIGKLRGDLGYVASYTLLINFSVALLGPIFFSQINSGTEFLFWESAISIFKKSSPLLVGPCLVAWFIRWRSSKVQELLEKAGRYSFNVWVFSLTIVSAQTVTYIMEHGSDAYTSELIMAGLSLVLSLLLFGIGWFISKTYFKRRFDPVISFAHKNTVLAIWMALTFLDPLSSICPSTYVIWQNILITVMLFKTNIKKGKNK